MYIRIRSRSCFFNSVAAAVNPRAFRGMNPLHAMVHADASTEIFYDLTKKVDGETFVYRREMIRSSIFPWT